ncbi:M28 family peptidase [soil metagenome]
MARGGALGLAALSGAGVLAWGNAAADDPEAAAEKAVGEAELAADEGKFLGGTRQLTFAGKRAGEGYFSSDGSRMIFQSERDEANPFFQMFVLDLESGDISQVSTGVGKTTCGWIHPDGKRVLFASTHADDEAEAKQQEEIEFRESGTERRYSWDYDENYDIYSAPLDGGAGEADLTNLTQTLGYDAEGSYSPDGEWVAFASNRQAYEGGMPEDGRAKFEESASHAIEIYRMRSDGSDVERLTDAPGYDGGPFFSADGLQICWRRFSEDGATAEIWTMDADGGNQKPVTRLGAMSWAPFFHPSGDYLIFATNLQGFANFELYIVDAAGEKEPVRVTTTEGFDGLASFSPDGETLTWTSNRTPGQRSQIFLADWNHAAAQAALSEAPPPAGPGSNGQGKGTGLAAVGAAAAAAAGGIGEVAEGLLEASVAAISAEDVRRAVDYLTSDALDGRLTGTEGERLATAFVADVFRGLGLEPAGEGGKYFEPFEFTAGVALGADNRLRLAGADKDAEIPGEDWIPLSFSESGDLGEAGVVFAGYGLEVPSEQVEAGGEARPEYSSFAHLDVADKWVMVFRYLPEGLGAEERQRFARYSSLRYKALVAREKGAKGIIVVSGPTSKVKEQLVPLTFDASLAGSGVGAIAVTDALAGSLLAEGGVQGSLEELQAAHDGGEMQAGIQLEGVKLAVAVDIEQEKREGRNVLARLPGGEEGAAAVAVGAHIDHLGSKAGANSRAAGDDLDSIHPGADDNASGVAGMLEIAQQMAADVRDGKVELQRPILFAAWSGEELGLLGSAHHVAEAVAALPEGGSLQDEIVAYLNMDMIGRLRESLILQGVGSSGYWPAAIEQRNVVVGLPLVLQDDSYLPTDATSFYLKGVPILAAFTGAHEDYHTPGDTADKVNYEGTAKIARLMGLLARGLATSDDVPEHKPMEKPENQGMRAGLRAYLGTIPDYAQTDVEGLKLSGVAKNGPAEAAGAQADDVIVSLAGREIKNIYDYTFAIEALKIGEPVKMAVLRQGERIELEVTPGSRD